MATEGDVVQNQMFLNSPGPSTSQNAGRGPQIAESHGGLSEQRIEVVVLRADNVPSIKKYGFLKRKLFVTASNRETTAKTANVRVEGTTVTWNENLGAL